MNKSLFSIATVCSALLFISCSVGTKVQIKADQMEYPVSQSNSFYSADDQLTLTDNYEILDDFSITFTKWGVSSIINIHSHEDISDRLNKIIEEQNGDAIIDMTISVYNPPVRNGLLLFAKTVALSAVLIATPITIIKPSRESVIIAGSSGLLYLFTPAAADIRVEGKVVRVSNK